MNSIIRLTSILVIMMTTYSIAMDVILKKQDCYEHDIESFCIDKNTTAHIITFYHEGTDDEVAYLDYQINKAESALIRMFVCDDVDEASKAFFFIIAEQHMNSEQKVKNISWFINKNDITFYQRFGASVYKSKEGDLCMKMPCNGKACAKLHDYYKQKESSEQ